MTKQTTKTKNTIYTDDITAQEWSELVTQVRNTEKTAEITDITVTGESAQLEYKVHGFSDRVFTQDIDAEINPNTKSDFEQLLEKHGYAPHEPSRLIGESLEVEMQRTDNGIKIDLPINESETEDQNTTTGQVTKTLFAGGLVGLIPLLNVVILSELLYEATIKEKFSNHDLVASIGLTMTMSIIYVALPVLYYMLI